MGVISISAVSAADDVVNQTDISSDAKTDDLQVSNPVKSEEVKSVSLKPTKLSTTYGSGKYFTVKATNTKTKKAAPNVKLLLKVQTGKKYKKVIKTTNSKGIAKYSASTLGVGTHKIIVKVYTKGITAKSKTSSVKIYKAKIKISAPKSTNYYKQSKKFTVTIKNKNSNKVMKGVKVKVKVFTGKKFKTYSLKTNKNGIVSFNTKSLKKGVHKIMVNVKATKNVKKASAKSSVKIVNAPQYIKVKVNGHVLNVKLVNNKATKSLVDKLKKGNIKIQASDYGDFEKVGGLGFSLPTDDKYITTSPGDIVLYQGNQVSLFYNSNSWDYTKLGKVQGVSASELRTILGSDDVVLTLSLK